MKRVYIKEEVCIACHLCEVHCQVEHSASKDPVKAFKRGQTPPLSGSRVEERKPISFSLRCYHCEDPACVYACLSGALQKNPQSGVVTVDTEKCIGCWTCILACPYGAIKQDTLRGKIAKCDLCPGQTVPVCVSNCPNEALIYAESKNDAPGR